MADPRATVEQYGDMVWRLSLARTASVHDAEDVFQEVFLRYLRHQDHLNGAEHIRAWLIRCTVNCSKSLLTAPWRRRTVALEEALAAPMDEEARAVYAAVLSLPQIYRTAIHLYYYEGLSVAEIAQATGCREGTVKSRLSRGRALLKGVLHDV